MDARQLPYSFSVPIQSWRFRRLRFGTALKGVMPSHVVICGILVISAAPASGSPPLALGLPPLAVAYTGGIRGAGNTDPYTPTRGIVVELDDSVAGFSGRLARQDENTANVSAPNSLRSSLCTWRVDGCQVLRAAKEKALPTLLLDAEVLEGLCLA